MLKVTEIESRFLSKVDWNRVINLDSCWFWSGSFRDIDDPYGQFFLLGKNCVATRVSIWLYHDLANSHFAHLSYPLACHTCDNSNCVNPSHLFKGTAQDNMLDCHAKNRNVFRVRENHAQAKLKESDILLISKLRQEGLSQAKIALRFGVSQPLVSMILKGKRWTAPVNSKTNKDYGCGK